MSLEQFTTVDDARQQRGLQIAALTKLRRNGTGWLVPSQAGTDTYTVDPRKGTCTCLDYQTRQGKCKHQWAVEFTVTRETKRDGSTTVMQSVRLTYKQDWPAYNNAQVHEKSVFMSLLHDLCSGIEEPPQTFGRPRLSLGDMAFSAAFKVYSTVSGRRFATDLQVALTQGYIAKAPHYNSVFNYFEMPSLVPVFRQLITESSLPLKAIERDFAVDSSGFGANRLRHWLDEKYGKEHQEREWVKAHLICGVSTHIVTSVEVTPTHSADAPFLPPLLEATTKSFTVNEVSADKAYSSKRNLRTIEAAGATPYIPFKRGTMAVTKVKAEQDTLWERMWHFYHFNQETFMEHYHKRSNVETVFSMIKGKFGDTLRSRTPTAQVNEVLCKVLCHNICVLIQSVFELGLEPTFWADSAVAQEVPSL